MFGAHGGIPQASLTMPETSRRELSNGVKIANSTVISDDWDCLQFSSGVQGVRHACMYCTCTSTAIPYGDYRQHYVDVRIYQYRLFAQPAP